jgi:hypothetical protein
MLKTLFAALALTLMTFFSAGDVQAQGYDVGGAWTCVGRCQVPGGRTFIEERGRGLTLYNEVRQPSRAYFADPFTIVATDWRATGRLGRSGDVIFWGNGTRWVR